MSSNGSALYEELLDCCAEVLVLHPGIGFEEWLAVLQSQYATEIEDAIGYDDEEIAATLAEIWAESNTNVIPSEQYQDNDN